MITGTRNFIQTNILGRKGGDDFNPEEKKAGLSDGARFGIAAGWTALATGVGAAFGASREGQDIVTYEKINYPEMERVEIGRHTEQGCYRYHYGYDFSSGDFGYHYGYDGSCTQEVPTYQDRPTGNILTRTLTHHSLNYPRTMLQGAMLGLGIGAITGIAGYILTESMKN